MQVKNYWLRFDSKAQAENFLFKSIEYAPEEYNRDDDELLDYVRACLDNYAYIVDKI